MKNRYLFSLMLLMALFVPWTAMAQDNTITLSSSVNVTIEPNTTYNFYDSGGPDSDYSTSQSYTATLTCVGDITIRFSQFVTELSSNCNNWDHMHIYDGDESTGNLLARGQTGCSSATLTTGTDYVATSGTMTIVWKSDGSNVAAGWVATITGGVAPTCPRPTGLIVSNITSSEAMVSWDKVTTTVGQRCFFQFVCMTHGASPDWSDQMFAIDNGNNSNPPYATFSGLMPLTQYDVYVRQYCGEMGQSGPTDDNYSDAVMVSFTTSAEPEDIGDSWSDDFEGTSLGWGLINGTQTNVWAWGTAINNGGTHSLYISNDSGTNNAYDNSSKSFVYATKLLTFADGKYSFTYDWIANGESNYDYLRAWLAPATAAFTEGQLPNGSTAPNDYTTITPTGWISLDGGGKLNQQTSWQSRNVIQNIAAGNYYLVFMWCNDGSSGNNPPAAVDNVSITKMEAVTTTHVANNITDPTTQMTWEQFASYVNGGEDFAGMTITLDEDISVTTSVGTNANRFKGTFDGNEHTITFTKEISVQLCAPFLWIEDANIQNLHTTGSINTSHQMAAGIVGRAFGNCTFTNCRSSMEITTSRNGDGTNGGMLAVLNNKNGNGSSTATFTGCVFDGKLISTNSSGTTQNAGFVGCSHYNYVVFNNCVFNPSQVTNMDGGNTCTFSRPDGTYSGNYFTFNNTYYTQSLGREQGKQAYSITGVNPVTVAMNGTPTTQYSVSGIDVYASGIVYNNTLYAGNGESVSLTLSGSAEGYQADYGDLTGTENPYTLTMASHNTVISIHVTPVGDPTKIVLNPTANDEMTWEQFASYVNSGNSFEGKTITLMEDITITSQANQAGSDGNYFSGTFDGNGKTITIDMTATGKHCAPFYGVKNATINNLVVTGSITSAYQGVGGICGVVSGNTTFTNCVSDVAITSTCSNTPDDTNGRSTCGGFVGSSGGGDNPTFVGCAFTGSLTASRNGCGGFIGFHASRSGWSGNYNGRSIYTNCFFAPSSINVTASETAVFTCGYSGGQYVNITVTNSYYNEEGAEMNLKQGKRAYSITGISPVIVAMSGTPTTQYSVSGIDVYALGIVFNNTLYAGNSENVDLVLNGSPSGVYEVTYGSITGTANPFTLAMTDHNTEILALTCAPPTNLSVPEENLGPYSAVLTWEGNADSYNVSYITAVYWESFENGLGDWTVYPGGDAGAIEWYVDDPSQSASLTAHSGNNVVWSFSDANVHADDWLVSPQLNLGGTLKYWVMSEYQDAYEVKLSTTGTEIADFTETLKSMAASENTWTEISIDLSAYEGQQGHIAFHHDHIGGFFLMIDDIGIYGWSEPVHVNGTSYLLEGLTPNTDYGWQVQADCGDEDGQSRWVESTFTTDLSCYPPTNLIASDVTARRATLSWDAEEDVTFQYSFPNTYHPNINPETLTYIDIQGNSKTLTNLRPDTEYGFFLRKNCGAGGYSEAVSVIFHTPEACPAPDSLEMVDVANHEATLSWHGMSEEYIVSYRSVAYFDGLQEEFNSSGLPSGWTKYSGYVDEVVAGTAELASTTSGWNTNSYALGTYNMKVNIYGTSCRYWLVTPEFFLDEDLPLTFDLALTDYGNADPIETPTEQADDRFVVLVYADGAWTILREWNNRGSSYVYNTLSSTGETVSLDLSAYYGKTLKIAFYGESTSSGGDNDLHIDNVVVGIPVEAGEWQTVVTTETTVELTGLVANTPYEAKIQGNCGSEGMSHESEIINFHTDIACPTPTDLVVSNLKSTTVDLSWTSYAESWQIQLGDADPFEVTENPYTLGGLEPETEYTLKLRGYCGAEDGYSGWTQQVFTTLESCPQPRDIEVSNITSHTATVNWIGDSENFTVNYRIAGGYDIDFTEDFADETAVSYSASTYYLPEGWQSYNSSNGHSPRVSNGSNYSYISSMVGNYLLLTTNATDQYAYAIMPQYSNLYEVQFNYAYESTSYGTLTVGYVTDNTGYSTYTVLQAMTASTSWTPFTLSSADLTAINNANGYIAFCYQSGNSTFYSVAIDNVTIVAGNNQTVGEWQSVTVTEGATTASLSGLEAGTKYDVKVIPSCDETNESAITSFITEDENMKIFLTEGDWGNASNWMNEDMPTLSDMAVLRANATITGVAEADQITFEGSSTLTVADGGQLKTNADVAATMKKNILGYGINYVETDNGYYLMALPTTAPISAANAGLMTNESEYDLYSWDRTATDEEWQNNHDGIDLQNGMGYLYANRNDMEMSFTATLRNSGESVVVTASFDEVEHGGWNLFGNPFPCEAYITTDAEGMTFYRLIGNELVPITGAIAPMEGFFVKATAAGQTFTISREAPEGR